ncbi:hypothetical protein DFH06DRAFT_1002235 [Mycena polygramma]|nr:hypothetical protein DFH06DRAFT_1002235 [Mycena polygramma]
MQFAPRRYAQQDTQVQAIMAHDSVTPAFEGSVFTTAQFNFGNGMSLLRRDTYDEFGSIRAITVLGNFNPDNSSWFLYWQDDEEDRIAMRCPPGTTLLVPTNVVRCAFTAIERGETRYLLQQSFNAALGRWVEQGFRSDADFEADLSLEELVVHRHQRRNRVHAKMALFSHLDEL